jgi:hypothetical protein
MQRSWAPTALRPWRSFRGASEDIRRYKLSLASSRLDVPNVNVAMTALRFFFKVTLRRGDVTEDIVSARELRRLSFVLSPMKWRGSWLPQRASNTRRP